MAEPIKVPFVMRTWVGPRNQVLDGISIPLREGAIFRGKEQPIVKYRDTLHSDPSLYI